MAKQKYKVVIIGFAHMHINGVAKEFFEDPHMEIVALADTKPYIPELNPDGMFARNYNIAHCRKTFNIPRTYDSYIEMLDKEKPDIALICCENAIHPEVIEECGKRKIDCNLEKPMAMSLSGGLEIARSISHHGHKVLVNWGIPFSRAINTMKRLYDEGKIGDLIEFKCRIGNPGPLGTGSKHPGIEDRGTGLTEAEKGSTWWHQWAAGGGAMTDFAIYGCLMSSWFMDCKLPLGVAGFRGNFKVHSGTADDESVVIAQFEKSLAIIEGTWTTRIFAGPGGPVL
ncbi:MAG: Gfo/Idh/MocA family oxidoreductase, partial [Clostridiales bacterium]|nr:Gfo/Idh/MocA family oxidoreductase [Clostridiales bacterium]